MERAGRAGSYPQTALSLDDVRRGGKVQKLVPALPWDLSPNKFQVHFIRDETLPAGPT